MSDLFGFIFLTLTVLTFVYMIDPEALTPLFEWSTKMIEEFCDDSI